jgi:hypothetical protein
MRTITETKEVFTYAELSESAQEQARIDYAQDGMLHDWYDVIYEDAKTIGALMGIEITDIYFSGFSSQGDGACFEGYYSYEKGSVRKVKEHAPIDTELHRIAQALFQAQAKCFYQLSAGIKQSGHYYHEFCTDISVTDARTGEWGVNEDTEESIIEPLRDFMRWIYKQLEAQYEYETSDENIKELSEINEWEYDKEGHIV